MSEENNKYQMSLNDIIHNCKGFPCKNDSFYNMQELVDNWNKLKEYLNNNISANNNLIKNTRSEPCKTVLKTQSLLYKNLLDKIQELDGSEK